MFVDHLEILSRITYSHPFIHLQTTGLLLLVIFVRALSVLKLLARGGYSLCYKGRWPPANDGLTEPFLAPAAPGRTHSWHLASGLPPGLPICGWLLSRDAGQRRLPACRAYVDTPPAPDIPSTSHFGTVTVC